MPHKKYLVTLTPEERQHLRKLVSAGKRSARTLTRARILLQADEAAGGPAWEDARIAEALRLMRTPSTVRPVRRATSSSGILPSIASCRFVHRGPW
jgi:hypothetical protein